MNWRLKSTVGAAMVWVLATTGCLPIPVPRTVVVVPDAQVEVVDGETGQPLEGAIVELRRIHMGPPPAELLDHWEVSTDDSGTVTFTKETERERHMPLMMHGVPQRKFSLCVRHEGYETEVGGRSRELVESGGRLDDEEFPWEVVFQLTRGEESDCPDDAY